jgi:molecular chaperone Hsp33
MYEDLIARCVVDGGHARVVLVTTTGVAREAARRHAATGTAEVALARGLTAGLLLATLTKDEERITLQVLGDGPLGGLTVDATAAGTARAYLKNPAARLPPPPPGTTRVSLARAMGKTGLVNVIRELGLRENFRGQTPMVSGEIDEDVAHYLTASEQIDSALACEVVLSPDGSVARAAGILVQALPGSEGARQVEAAREALAGGALLRALLRPTARAAAFPQDLFRDALGGAERLGDLQVMHVRPVEFHCPCSRERASVTLGLLGQAELGSMILEDGKAEVICNFCRVHYDFSETELETIRRDVAKPVGPPS